jgi:hypothetical protein
MNRREFLAKTAQAGIGLGLVAGIPCAGEEAGQRDPKRAKMTGMNFIWSGIDPNASTHDLKERYKALRAHGIDGVFIGGGIDDREFDAAKENGVEVHTWMWTTNRGDDWIRKNHPDWYMVSRSGKSCFDKPPYVDYYRWISPVIPGVQRYLEDRVAELAAHPAVSGVHLDYVRYPDVILPDALWEHYGLDQTEELPDYDFCYSEHTRAAFKKECGRDPIEIADPATDQEWLHWRQETVTKLVKRLAKVAHAHEKLITAAVFPTPSLARKICRQDWDKWPLDAAAPMVYNSFYNAPVKWIGDCIREDIEAATFPIYAGLYMPALSKLDDFKDAIRLARKRGAVGLSLFGGVDDAHWKVLEELGD